MTLPTTATAASQADDRCPTCGERAAGSWLVCAHCGTRLATAAPLAPGALLRDRFRVQAVLGRGGFGITYAVTDERLERRVAIKELFPDAAVRHGCTLLTPPHARAEFDEARERFLREARTLARFSHPGIVRVFEVFEQHNTAYLVLELVDGPSLADVLARRGAPLAEPEVLDVARRVAGALLAVHQAGMLHRDLNPSNLVRTSTDRIVLIDFGLAKAFGDDPAASMTRILTPGYAPIEQYEGKGRFGPPTDVYGLAATLYRLITGQTPVPAFERVAGTPLPPPQRITPEVSRSTSDALLDGLELRYEHRPATVAAFLARLGVDPPARIAAVVLHDDDDDDGDGGPVPVPPAPAVAPDRPALDSPPPPTTPEPARRHQPVDHPAPARWTPPVPTGSVGGHGRADRWRAGVPLVAAAVSLCSAAPVLCTFLLAAVAVPAVATLGDLAERRRSGRHDGRLGRGSGAGAVVVSAARNLVVAVGRSALAFLLVAVSVAIWYLLGDLGPPLAGQLWLRATGAGAAAVVCTLAPRAGHLQVGEGLDELAGRVTGSTGRLDQTGWVLWIGGIASTAAGLFLTPEVWPLP